MMNSLPNPLGGRDILGWRVDPQDKASRWNGGDGPASDGGRWSLPGVAVVYASLDPATAILETVINKGVDRVRREPAVLTSFTVTSPDVVAVVWPDDVPDPEWLTCEEPDEAQRRFGTALLAFHPFIIIPSACSPRSWNLVFDRECADGHYAVRSQETLRI